MQLVRKIFLCKVLLRAPTIWCRSMSAICSRRKRPAAGLFMVSHRSRLRLLRSRCAPLGDTVCQSLCYKNRKLSSRALVKGDGAGSRWRWREVQVMWDYLVRRWRVEVALLECYWDALKRGDQYSYRYWADHSLLVSAFCLAVLIGGNDADRDCCSIFPVWLPLAVAFFLAVSCLWNGFISGSVMLFIGFFLIYSTSLFHYPQWI